MIRICNRPGRSPFTNLALIAAGALLSACSDPEAIPSSSEAPPPPELADLQPQLEKVVEQLGELDHLGLPQPGARVTAAALRIDMGPLADRIFVAMADGAEEVPPVTTGASALMALIVEPIHGDILFALLHDVANASAAHIHRGAGGSNGPVVVPLDHRRAFTIGHARLSADDVANLQAGRMYTNVHSSAFPNGEVRGQLLRLGEAMYTASLSGAEEVPPRDSRGSGSLTVILNAGGDEIRSEGTFKDLTTCATAAHIHQAPATVNGPIRFELTIVPMGMLAGNLTGVHAVTAPDVALLDAAGFYVNVHSVMFQGGEIRGQLTRK